jgi:hypothetical protein
MRKARLLKALKSRSTVLFTNITLGLIASLLLAGLLSACGPSKHPAAAAVEAYLRALVGKDENRLVSLTCQAFEDDTLLEYDSFSLVQTRLEGLKCQVEATGINAANVACQGQIIATYGAEDQQFDLSGRKYLVQKSGSDWLVCGQQ